MFNPGDKVRLDPKEEDKRDQLPSVFSWDKIYTVAEVLPFYAQPSGKLCLTNIRLEGSLIDWWDAAWFIAA